MNDMRHVIVPKSDQINADDLIGGPRTIRITGVDISPGTEQPVSIFFDGDSGKPWRPCKSMSRVLVAAWGPDANAYAGRSATLYRDPKVKWGGLEVGGIRVSHLSDIDREMVMALTATKGKRTPYTVKPLACQEPSTTSVPPKDRSPEGWANGAVARFAAISLEDEYDTYVGSAAYRNGKAKLQRDHADLFTKVDDAERNRALAGFGSDISFGSEELSK